MAKIDDVKLSKVRSDGKAEIIFRLYVTKTFSPQFRSGLFINPDRFIQPDRTYRDKDGKERISTGILRNCVTWYVRDLEAMNLLQSIFVGRDNTTGFLAKHYSADKTQWKSRKQEIQLSLFGEGSL